MDFRSRSAVSNPGFIYVLINPSMTGLLNVGKTIVHTESPDCG